MTKAQSDAGKDQQRPNQSAQSELYSTVASDESQVAPEII